MTSSAQLALVLACCALVCGRAIAQTPEATWLQQNKARLQQVEAEAKVDRARLDAAISAALAADFRPMDHRLRDEQRGARLILTLADAKPGDRVLDVGSGGGYLALLMSAMVGETGHVDVHNTPGWIAQFPSMDPEVLKPRLNRPNLGYIAVPWNDLPGAAASYDVITLGQVYHDVVLEGADMAAFNARLFELLKPGGRLVIEDHEADPNMPLGRQVGLHRIAKTEVIPLVTAAGFNSVALLAIADLHDDLRRNVFTPGIRGRTSRYILMFEKPASR